MEWPVLWDHLNYSESVDYLRTAIAVSRTPVAIWQLVPYLEAVYNFLWLPYRPDVLRRHHNGFVEGIPVQWRPAAGTQR